MAQVSVYSIAVAGIIIGQAIMLYGVYLTSGETLNVPMAVGGVVVIAAIGVLTWALFDEDQPETGDGHGHS